MLTDDIRAISASSLLACN